MRTPPTAPTRPLVSTRSSLQPSLKRPDGRQTSAADFRVNLATALAGSGQLDEAVAQLEQASSLRPGDAEVLAQLAALHEMLGHLDQAERHYEAAVAATPEHAQWHAALARRRYARWAMPEALQSAAHARALSSEIANALNMDYAEPSAASALRRSLPEGYASLLEFQKRNLPPNRRMPFAQWLQRREATWEWLFEVPMRFNRLVMFRSDFFHAITTLFGDSFENGRLVQLFHFEAKP